MVVRGIEKRRSALRKLIVTRRVSEEEVRFDSASLTRRVTMAPEKNLEKSSDAVGKHGAECRMSYWKDREPQNC